MKFASIASRYTNTIWCASESVVKSIGRLIVAAQNGIRMDGGSVSDASESEMFRSGSVGVIKIRGVIGRHLSSMESECGGVDVDWIRASFDAFLFDDTISMIAMDIDSPGGTVTGVPELAQYIRASAKPVIAWTGVQACSAACYLASAASVFSCAPTALTGSVGVYLAWIDHSKRMEREGDEWIVIKSGSDKAFSIDGQLNDSARAALQEDAVKTHEDFKAFLTATRAIDSQYLEGMHYYGQKALSIGMVDANHDTFEQFLQEATNGV